MNRKFADTSVTPAGNVSVTRTLVAGPGPLLMMFMLYVRFLPTVAGFGNVVFVIERSAWAAALMLTKDRRNMRMVAARKEFRLVRIFSSPCAS
jgi:hypothetical protein